MCCNEPVTGFCSCISGVFCEDCDPLGSCRGTCGPSDDDATSCNEVSCGGDPECFSLDTIVQVRNVGSKKMIDVGVGEKVLTSSGSYKIVYSIDHLVEHKE